MAHRDLNPASTPPAAPNGLFGLATSAVTTDEPAPQVRRSIHGNRIHAGAAVTAVAEPPRPGRVEAQPGEQRAAKEMKPGQLTTRLVATVLAALALMVVAYAVTRWRTEVEASNARVHPGREAARGLSSELPVPETAVESAAPSKPPAKILRDEAGTIVSVRGTDAEAVLAAWCEAQGSIDPRSLHVARTVPERPEVRVGLWRGADGSGEHAIQIFRQHAGSYWIAGDGKRPVPVFDPARLSFASPTPLR